MHALTDAQIKALQTALVKKLDQLKARKLSLKQEDPFADSDRVVDNAAVDSEAAEQFGHERVEAMIKEVTTSIQEAKRALLKIADKTYGACEACGQPIGIARLNIDPGAIYCVSCERKHEEAE